ncbi:hypothetical protein GCM10015535_38620 [Streptomyces gelaticus]|uniref:Uncharacterized protein n=1 Tax=Streptomyces gelaticus TaxID=285446 RepID=A0ABQ2W0K5_9ACTN|nr:hypothetical protein GCM10015535_38620 [Streptomyces gelaticus]
MRSSGGAAGSVTTLTPAGSVSAGRGKQPVQHASDGGLSIRLNASPAMCKVAGNPPSAPGSSTPQPLGGLPVSDIGSA